MLFIRSYIDWLVLPCALSLMDIVLTFERMWIALFVLYSLNLNGRMEEAIFVPEKVSNL